MIRAVRGNLNHLAAQPPHQRGIFAHRVYNDNPILGNGKKDVEQLPLCREALAGASRAQVEPIRGFQLFPVRHNDVVGKCVHAVIEGRPGHAELPGHKGNEDRRGAGSHAPLDFHLIPAQGQGGNKALLLLPVQPLQCAVVFLRDTAHRENIIFQPLAGGGQIYHGKGQEEHPLVAGLEVGQKLRRVLGKCDKVGRQNVGVISGPDSFALFLHFHFSNVRNFPLDGFNRL